MSTEKNIKSVTKVYNEWLKANPGVDDEHPTDEEEADYMRRLVKANPSITGEGWAEAVSRMSEDEKAELLRSPEYNGTG
jgi:hypothetical protein